MDNVQQKTDTIKGLVSVIVPMLNTEKYIERCLKSIQDQTYSNLEIIVIDNASKDSSCRRVKELAKTDTRIRLFKNESTKSVGYSRNRGLDNSRGEYIWFVDSDDYAEPEFIEKMLSYMKEYDVDIVQCCYKDFDEFNCYKDYLPFHEKKIFTGRELDLYMTKFVGLCGPNVMLWNKLYKRDVWAGVLFLECFAYEDMHLTYKLFYGKERILWVDDRLINWRKSITSNTSRANYTPSLIHELHAYIDRVEFFRRNDDNELADLTLKRLYYTAAQHYYMNRYFCNDDNKFKREQSIKYILKRSWEELKGNAYFPMRTRLRFLWIHWFPMEFGRRSIKRKVDFTI